MSKHTPGPWEAEHHRSDGEPSDGPGHWTIEVKIVHYSADPYGVVADTLNRDHRLGPDDDAANARLLAAAPDLLSGCHALLGLIQLIGGRDDLTPELIEVLSSNHRIAEAEAAVAKATESLESGSE